MGTKELPSKTLVFVGQEPLPSLDPTKDVVGTRITVEHNGDPVSRKVVSPRFYPLGKDAEISVPAPFYNLRVNLALRRARVLAQKISK